MALLDGSSILWMLSLIDIVCIFFKWEDSKTIHNFNDYNYYNCNIRFETYLYYKSVLYYIYDLNWSWLRLHCLLLFLF